MFFEKEYAAGRVRAMRARLLGKNAMASMGSAKSVSDVVLALAGTHYEHAFSKRNLEHNERELKKRPAHALKKVLEFVPKEYYDDFFVFSLEADAKNLKACVRGLAGGLPWKRITRDFVECGIVFEKTRADIIAGFDALAPALNGTPWHGVLKKYESEGFDITAMEHEIDSVMFTHAEKVGSNSVKRFFLEKKELSDFRILSLAEDAGIAVPENLLFMPHLREEITKKHSGLKEGCLEKNIRAHLLALSHELMLLEPFGRGLFIDYIHRTESEARFIAACARDASSKVQAEQQEIQL